MLTAADRLILQALRIERWHQNHPRIAPFFHSVELPKLTLNTESYTIASILIRSSNYLLQDAAIILGVSKLEILQNRQFAFAIELQSIASNSTQDTDTEEMTATLTTEQQNNRAIEFQPVEEQSLVIPWTQITKTIGASEDELKAQLTSARIPFLWAENKEWGVIEDDAILLIKKYYEAQAAMATQRMRAAVGRKTFNSEETHEDETNQATTDVANRAAPAKKRSSGNSKPIRLTTEFKPVKNLFETVKRFVEAITDDATAQMKELEEIISGSTRGKKFIKLALEAYELGTAPNEGELISTFVRLRDRRIKEANKANTQQQPTDPQGEEIVQN